jgi:hypothetical protein
VGNYEYIEPEYKDFRVSPSTTALLPVPDAQAFDWHFTANEAQDFAQLGQLLGGTFRELRSDVAYDALNGHPAICAIREALYAGQSA